MKIQFKLAICVLVFFPTMTIAQPVFYGTTSFEGSMGGGGSAFIFNARSKYLAVVAPFTDHPLNPWGRYPSGALMLANNGYLYGLTQEGGNNGVGALYVVDPNSFFYDGLYSFAPATGGRPFDTKLMQASDGKLYGVTGTGGAFNRGVLFSFDINSNTYTKLVDFDGVNLATPRSPLFELSPGLLYGTSRYGGSSNNGTIYKYSIATNALTKIHDFNNTNGSSPIGSLVKANDGKLYGLAEYGGAQNTGVLYSIDPANDSYSVVKEGGAGIGLPTGSPIVASNGKIYWIHDRDGVFSYSPATGEYAWVWGVLESCNGTLVQASDGKLYGVTTWNSITNSHGSIFSIDLSTNTGVIESDIGDDIGWWPVQEHGLVEIVGCDKTITAAASSNGPLCNGSSLQLSAAGATTYYWTGPGNFTSNVQNPVINNVSAAHAGTYRVYTANSANFLFCYSMDSVVVAINQPDAATITASAALSFCEGGEVTLSSNYTTGNQWQRNGENITGATDNEYIATSPGTYRSVVTTAEACITTSNELNVVVNPLPATPVATAAGPVSFCEGGQVVLSSSATTGNQWLLNGEPITGAGSNQYAASTTGTYQVIVTNTSGCTAASNQIIVTKIASPAKPVISANGPLTFCAGGEVVLTSSSVTSNQWQLNGQPITGATGSQHTAQAAGNYRVAVTNNDGCTAVSDLTAVAVNPLPAEPTIMWNGSLLSTTSGFAGYVWHLDGQPISGASTASITPASNGVYTVTVIDNNACSATSAGFSLALRASGDILFGDTRVRVTPNPAIDNLRIEVINPGNKVISMTLWTTTGYAITTRQLPGHVTNIPITHLTPGVYSLQLRAGDKQQTVKILISR